MNPKWILITGIHRAWLIYQAVAPCSELLCLTSTTLLNSVSRTMYFTLPRNGERVSSHTDAGINKTLSLATYGLLMGMTVRFSVHLVPLFSAHLQWVSSLGNVKAIHSSDCSSEVFLIDHCFAYDFSYSFC